MSQQTQESATAPSVRKEYVPLSRLKDIARKQCEAILENHMQCWRHGDVLCIVSTGEEKQNIQFCLAHSLIEQQKDRDNPEFLVKQESHPLRDLENKVEGFLHLKKEKEAKFEEEKETKTEKRVPRKE